MWYRVQLFVKFPPLYIHIGLFPHAELFAKEGKDRECGWHKGGLELFGEF